MRPSTKGWEIHSEPCEHNLQGEAHNPQMRSIVIHSGVSRVNGIKQNSRREDGCFWVWHQVWDYSHSSLENKS